MTLSAISPNLPAPRSERGSQTVEILLVPTPPGHIWQCLETFLVAAPWWGEGAGTGISRGDGRGCRSKYPTTRKIVPTTGSYLVRHVTSAQVENARVRKTWLWILALPKASILIMSKSHSLSLWFLTP